MTLQNIEATVMVSTAWTGRDNWPDFNICSFRLQFEGVLPISILYSKLVFDRDFSQNIFVAGAIGDDTSFPKNRLVHQYSHWWCFASISALVLEPDQNDCPLPIQMILIDIDHLILGTIYSLRVFAIINTKKHIWRLDREGIIIWIWWPNPIVRCIMA